MTSAPDLQLPGDSQLGIEEFPVNKIARHHAWNMSVDICKFQLFCFRFSSHLIKKRPFCYMAFHKCFVSSIVEMIGSIREIIPIQIGLSLSDEIRADVFAFLLLASASCFFFWFSFLVFRRRRPALVRKSTQRSDHMRTRTSSARHCPKKSHRLWHRDQWNSQPSRTWCFIYSHHCVSDHPEPDAANLQRWNHDNFNFCFWFSLVISSSDSSFSFSQTSGGPALTRKSAPRSDRMRARTSGTTLTQCLSKWMVTYLEAFVRVSPFFKTQDPTKFPSNNSVAVVAIYAGDPPTSECTDLHPRTVSPAASEAPGPARFVAWLPTWMPAMALSDDESAAKPHFFNKRALPAG